MLYVILIAIFLALVILYSHTRNNHQKSHNSKNSQKKSPDLNSNDKTSDENSLPIQEDNNNENKDQDILLDINQEPTLNDLKIKHKDIPMQDSSDDETVKVTSTSNEVKVEIIPDDTKK